MIYDVKQKDKIDLQLFNIIVNKDIPYAESNPFSMALEKIETGQDPKNTQDKYNTKREDILFENLFEDKEKEESSFVAFNTQQNESYVEKDAKIGQVNVKIADNIQQPVKKTELSKKEGFFSRIFGKKPSVKKIERLVLAADSEFKRKQWIFTLNFYKSIILKIQNGEKLRFQTEENIHKHHTVEGQRANEKWQEEEIEEQLEEIGGLHDIDDKDDYYNVFAQKAPETEEVKGLDQEQQGDENRQDSKRKKKENDQENQKNYQKKGTQNTHGDIYETKENKKSFLQEITETAEKNANRLDSEEALLTLTFPNFFAENKYLLKQYQLLKRDNIVISSKEIRTYTDQELWEKFVKHFFSSNHKHIDLQLQNQEVLDHGQLKKLENSSTEYNKLDVLKEKGNQKREEQQSNQLDYCVTDLDEEPTAKNVFSNKYSYVVNKNKII